MKWVAIILNVLLVITISCLFLIHGAPREGEILLFALLFTSPISSIVALALNGSDTWIGLYFKRKALEEKQRIERLCVQMQKS
jgi:hypothetical protein